MKSNNSRRKLIVTIIRNATLLFKLLSIISKPEREKIRKLIHKVHNNYHNHLARKLKQIKRRPKNHGVFLHTTTMIRNVTMRGQKIFMTVKMFIVVEKIKMLQRSLSQKEKLQDKKVIK